PPRSGGGARVGGDRPIRRATSPHPFVLNPTHAPSGTRVPAGGSWARTTASPRVGSPDGVPVPTTFRPAVCIWIRASLKGSPTASGTSMVEGPAATHSSGESGVKNAKVHTPCRPLGYESPAPGQSLAGTSSSEK